MRVLGIPVVGPRTALRRTIRDLEAVERLIVTLPDQLERGLTLGEELVVLAHEALEKADRLDARAAEIEKFRVAASELAAILPALELASGLASPLGSAIDRVGRIVGFPSTGSGRRREQPRPDAGSTRGAAADTARRAAGGRDQDGGERSEAGGDDREPLRIEIEPSTDASATPTDAATDASETPTDAAARETPAALDETGKAGADAPEEDEPEALTAPKPPATEPEAPTAPAPPATEPQAASRAADRRHRADGSR